MLGTTLHLQRMTGTLEAESSQSEAECSHWISIGLTTQQILQTPWWRGSPRRSTSHAQPSTGVGLVQVLTKFCLSEVHTLSSGALCRSLRRICNSEKAQEYKTLMIRLYADDKSQSEECLEHLLLITERHADESKKWCYLLKWGRQRPGSWSLMRKHGLQLSTVMEDQLYISVAILMANAM